MGLTALVNSQWAARCCIHDACICGSPRVPFTIFTHVRAPFAHVPIIRERASTGTIRTFARSHSRHCAIG